MQTSSALAGAAHETKRCCRSTPVTPSDGARSVMKPAEVNWTCSGTPFTSCTPVVTRNFQVAFPSSSAEGMKVQVESPFDDVKVPSTQVAKLSRESRTVPAQPAVTFRAGRLKFTVTVVPRETEPALSGTTLTTASVTFACGVAETLSDRSLVLPPGPIATTAKMYVRSLVRPSMVNEVTFPTLA